MLRFSGSSQNPGSSVLDELQLSNGLLWKAGEETITIGSRGDLQRASNNTARSQGGIRDHTVGLSLSAPRSKRVTRSCLPTDCPLKEAW